MMICTNGSLACDNCRQFVSPSKADYYTPFGNGYDVDPPDEEALCQDCSKADEEEMVKQGRPWSHWIPSKADFRAAKRLGFAQAGYRGTGWSRWCNKKKPLPDERYVWREEELVESLSERTKH